jgi:hypothetical protein
MVPKTQSGGRDTALPKLEKYLIQIRLSAADRRRIRSLAAKQDLTLQKAVVVAFDAWAEKLRGGSQVAKPNSAQPSLPDQPEPERGPDRSWAWLTRAVQLDWTKCPEVDLLTDGTNEIWVLRDSDAPLSEVLGCVADGNSVPEVAEIFQLDLPQLTKVIEFAG